MQMLRFEIKNKPQFGDSHSAGTLKTILEDTGIELSSLETIKAYNINEALSPTEAQQIKNDLLCDAVYQESREGFAYAKELDYDFAIEVAYKNGVTDNVGRTTARGMSFILGRDVNFGNVRSSAVYFFKGKADEKAKISIAENVLCNTLIEDYRIFTRESFSPIDYFSYQPENTGKPYFDVINLEVSDAELEKISADRVLSLTLEEMKAIREYFRKDSVKAAREKMGLPTDPTDVEMELFGQTWSEHCKHKIFAAEVNYKDGNETKTIKNLFKTYIKGSTDKIKEKRDDLLSLFKDNAGVVKFDDDYAYCVKVETHNSPSALDPYGGAMTGIVGVNRDIIGTGLGAYPIFNTDVFCFGSPYTEDENVPEGLMHPRRIFRGVHRGVKDGGNESGIPTVNGSITFDPSFLGKPLVFCGTGGLMPLQVNGKESFEKYVQAGDQVVMCGGFIGKDGIHGATFSSVQLTEASPTSAVQIGDPITQKKMLDFLMEARDAGMYSGLTDNGAGGLASSIGEMAQFTNGARLDLEKCPLKYAGLKPWEILLSEAQERMSIAVPKDKVAEFLALAKRRDVEANVIGEFTDSGMLECFYNGERVSTLDLEMLHEGNPGLKIDAQWTAPKQTRAESNIVCGYGELLKTLLARPNVASKENWVRMYDHEVQARTVNKPFTGKENDGPSDGGVLKVFPDKNEGLVITHGMTPRYSRLDTYQMTANVIDEAVRQAIILGANPDTLVGLDNFCWPDPVQSEATPDGTYKMAQLVRSCEALYDFSIAYNCPCISGKDSMKNDYRRGGKKVSVLPTLLFTVTGKSDDITKTVSFYFKKPGKKIYLIGKTKAELGASEYFEMLGIKEGIVPTVDNPEKTFAMYKKLAEVLKKGLLDSAHDLSDGGLAVALSEAAFSGNTGASIDVSVLGAELTAEEKLFSESPSRILVSVDSANEKAFLETIGQENAVLLGETNDSDFVEIKDAEGVLVRETLADLKDGWKTALDF